MQENEQPVITDSDNTENTNQEKQPEMSMEDKILEKMGLGDVKPKKEAGTSETEETGETTDTEEQSPETEIPLETVDFEGKQYQVPKDIKDALLRHSDYTKKTQEVASVRKSLDAQAKMLQEQSALQQELQDDYATMRSLQQQYQAYQKLDWSQMDTENLIRNRMAMDQLRDAMSQVHGSIQSKTDDFKAKQVQTMKQIVEQGQQILSSAIPGWGDELRTNLKKHATSFGFTEEELTSFFDPRQIQVLHKAYLWDQLQASKPGIKNRVNQAPPILKPGASKQKMSTKAVLRKTLHTTTDPKAKAKIAHRLIMEKL